MKVDRVKLRPQEPLVLALDDLDLAWYQHEVDLVKELWRKGKSIKEIAQHVRGKGDDALTETACLIMHLSRKYMIDHRPRGVWG